MATTLENTRKYILVDVDGTPTTIRKLNARAYYVEPEVVIDYETFAGPILNPQQLFINYTAVTSPNVTSAFHLKTIIDSWIEDGQQTFTGATINNLLASGSSTFNTVTATTVSASTIYSGSTDIGGLFLSSSNGALLQAQMTTKVNRSGDTMTGQLTAPAISGTSVSATTIFSASTDISNLFGSLSSVSLLQGQINTKVNRSGDTMTGQLTTTALSATTLSATTLYSGSTDVSNLFANSADVLLLQGQMTTKVNRSGDTMTGQLTSPIISGISISATTIYSASTDISNLFGSSSSVVLLQNQIGTKVNRSGDTMTGQLTTTALSATTVSGGTIYSASTDLSGLFTHTHVGVLLQAQINTKVNKSGDTMTGQLTTPILSATTLSASTYYSGSTPLETIIQSFATGGSPFFESGVTGAMSVQLKNSANLASGTTAFVIGMSNSGYSAYSFIGSGNGNISSGNISNPVIVGGTSNKNYSSNTFIGNGNNNRILASSTYSSILNGFNNTIEAYATASSIIGGTGHQVYGSYSSIVGGTSNKISSTVLKSSVLGGDRHIVTSNFSSILAGSTNTVNEVHSLIGAGKSNIIYNTTIVGSGYNSIFNGLSNKLSGNTSTILNGKYGILFGTYSTLLNGLNNVIPFGVNFSAILAGSGITAFSSHTVYSPHVVAASLTSTTVRMVYTEADGHLISGLPISTFADIDSKLNTKANLSGATFTGPISAATISGTSISATTFYSGSTELGSLFSAGAGVTIAQLNTKVSKSGDTMTGQLTAPLISGTSISATTFYSGSTDLSLLLGSGNGGGVTLAQLDTKVSKSGDTMTGTLASPIVSATTITATTIFSGASDVGTLFVTKTGDVMTGQLRGPAISATTLSGGTILSGSTNLHSIFVRKAGDTMTGSLTTTSSVVADALTGNTVFSGGTDIGTLINRKINRSGDTMIGIHTFVVTAANTMSATTVLSGLSNVSTLFVHPHVADWLSARINTKQDTSGSTIASSIIATEISGQTISASTLSATTLSANTFALASGGTSSANTFTSLLAVDLSNGSVHHIRGNKQSYTWSGSILAGTSPGVIWTNMPAGKTTWLHQTTTTLTGDATFIADFNGCTQCRLFTSMQVAGAGATTNIIVEYSRDNTNWFTLVSLTVANSTGAKDTGWSAIPDGAKDYIYIRLVGTNGNGTVDPRFSPPTLLIR